MTNNRNINIFVECGEKGIGKTTYVRNQWNKHIFLQCDDPLNEVKTTSILENALFSVYGKSYEVLSDIIYDLRKVAQDGYAIILDSAEFIDEAVLKLIINTMIPIENVILVFTFDIDYKYIYQCKIFRLLIEWDIVSSETQQKNYCAPLMAFKKLITDNLSSISKNMVNELLEISSQNFNNLKKLIWLVRNKHCSMDKVNEEVIAEYSFFLVEEKFSDLPRDLFDILKKTSIIGEIFNKCILESRIGFHISGVKAYLEKLEAMNIFIHSYLNEDLYRFVTNRMHVGVLKCVNLSEKIEWEKVLLNYYLEKLRFEKSNDKTLEYLRQMKRLSYSLNDIETTFFVNKRLLHLYLKVEDLEKARIILDELIKLCKEYIEDDSLCQFLCFYMADLNMKIGFSKEALDAINIVRNDYPNISPLYTQYYYAKCLYDQGDVDQSYLETLHLSKKLEPSSKGAVGNQPIYALTYSLLATIQHHFGIEDNGRKYYALALNHATNKLEDKSIYYDILKKCDMYFAYPFSKKFLPQSIAYFERKEKHYEASEVYVNLATEMMFNEVGSFHEAKEYFDKAIRILENTPNERLVYAQNNLALLYILFTDDINAAISLLENSLLVGLSSFTYMTVYLNLCMCYLVLHSSDSTQFQDAYDNFKKYNSKIMSRKNATQYDEIYEEIVDLIVLEHHGEKTEVLKKANDILSGQNLHFFLPILNDIKIRNSGMDIKQSSYTDNSNYYISLNNHKIFLAEFRFWE